MKYKQQVHPALSDILVIGEDSLENILVIDEDIINLPRSYVNIEKLGPGTIFLFFYLGLELLEI